MQWSGARWLVSEWANFFIILSGMRLRLLGTAATTGLLSQSKKIDDFDCGAIGGMRICRGNRRTRRKPAPLPLCPPWIPHDLPRAPTRAVAVGSQRLTAWALARLRMSEWVRDLLRFSSCELLQSVSELLSELENCCGSVLVSCCCQKLVAVARGQCGNPEEGESPPLEAVTRQPLVKTQQTEKT
jgi:hypothetical protein